MKKEISHKNVCGDGLVYSNRKGKCINPKLEDENLNEYNEDPSDRSKIPTKSLRFKHTAGKGVDGVSNESDD